MKCPACGGKGFTEEEHGLLQIGCQECKTTGEVADVVTISDVLTEIGLVLRLVGGGEWIDVLEQMTGQINKKILEGRYNPELPYLSMTMPCGEQLAFETEADVLAMETGTDILCPCGNPNHYLVRFIDNRNETQRSPKSGEYYCSACSTIHRETSKVGKKHLK